MNDRELLEKAASSMGAVATRLESGNYTLEKDGEYISMCWNPLEDDGDTFRLMVARHIDVEYYEGFSEVRATPYEIGVLSGANVEFTEDRAADTRRAIVLAAALSE